VRGGVVLVSTQTLEKTNVKSLDTVCRVRNHKRKPDIVGPGDYTRSVSGLVLKEREDKTARRRSVKGA